MAIKFTVVFTPLGGKPARRTFSTGTLARQYVKLLYRRHGFRVIRGTSEARDLNCSREPNGIATSSSARFKREGGVVHVWELG